MDDQEQAKIIKDNPIGKDVFHRVRVTFELSCNDKEIPCTLDALGQLDKGGMMIQLLIRILAETLLVSLRLLPLASQLRSKTGCGSLDSDLRRLIGTIADNYFDLDRIEPLLQAVLADDPDDALIWDRVYEAVTEITPPKTSRCPPIQTPFRQTTGSLMNTSELRDNVDGVLKKELGALYVGLPRFHEAFFGRVADLEEVSAAVFKKCKEGNEPLFKDGWIEWPRDAKEEDVLRWLRRVHEKLVDFAEIYKTLPRHPRWLLAQPNKVVQGSVADRKLDVAFLACPKTEEGFRHTWWDILIPGELKSNPSADAPGKAWLDLGTYAREVLAAQDNRRFVLGFTLCGSLMRVWEFDRLGGIASEQFDINKDGERFVSTIIGFTFMSEEELGLDPTIMTGADGKRFIEIQRNDSTERVMIDRLMLRTRYIVGRATTCWKAYREGQPETPLVIKDSWQHVERDEEGELLREAIGQDVANVARYYHHETVQVGNKDDDIWGNVRGGLDVATPTNYPLRPEPSMPPPSITAARGSSRGRSKSTGGRATGKKRSSSQILALLPSSKRACSISPTNARDETIPNRVHRRVVLRDYGKSIYKASSRSALLAALEGCIGGHESLYKAGFLHRDISINNLMINEDEDNPSQRSFLIDLDLAIQVPREAASGAKHKTGTRAFMAIGALLGEQHSFMHDLESFFWVLFWLCIHYTGPGQSICSPVYDIWNYTGDESLATLKAGTISSETMFLKTASTHFTRYYQPLIPWVNRLRRKVFPNDKRWKKPDLRLYSAMKDVLREAQKDPKVLADDG
ncbi:hypothetical protein Z517_09186 [Fonsecaea pedrosoi CBS 271.37]|uniref:non-specific serine/threonine protein kinase n=1 Tax=Fonsecaea pedrosoi CBS 271.37 TaxID=1442368 RepID=A0A0D2ER52_9EURO|nr:uncharacterized protein Z517_09186 [Fonsecaea pedrosoi CBS 271.37]KIW76742.1 hypothetical protein Z517_09186 [Fonsecaea pedrosoi CBS 271.37]